MCSRLTLHKPQPSHLPLTICLAHWSYTCSCAVLGGSTRSNTYGLPCRTHKNTKGEHGVTEICYGGVLLSAPEHRGQAAITSWMCQCAHPSLLPTLTPVSRGWKRRCREKQPSALGSLSLSLSVFKHPPPTTTTPALLPNSKPS